MREHDAAKHRQKLERECVPARVMHVLPSSIFGGFRQLD